MASRRKVSRRAKRAVKAKVKPKPESLSGLVISEWERITKEHLEKDSVWAEFMRRRRGHSDVFSSISDEELDRLDRVSLITAIAQGKFSAEVPC